MVAQQMRDDILYGRLRPGERLRFPELCRVHEASVGAIREALVLLTSQGLVKSQAHQGYIVTPLSEDDLLALTSARLAVEPLVLRRAVIDGDLAWEGRVVTSHHVMSRIPRETVGDRQVADEWVVAHEAFHAALFSGASNRRLLGIVGSFAEEAALYRRWSMPLETHRDVAAEHEGIMEAALGRDADLATERLCAHISATAQLLIEHADEITAPS
jgi:DNA-binding GntR family transcriptional regulator